MENSFIHYYKKIEELVLSKNFLSQVSDGDSAQITFIIEQSLAEALWALQLLSKHTNQKKLKNKTILEIGAGCGFLSAILSLAGYKVTSIEPSSGIFSYHGRIVNTLFKNLGIHHTIIDSTIENITESEIGTFDIIFSINVLEHVNSVKHAFEKMSVLLHDDGCMLHVCPNYCIPYEPHLGIVLIPLYPSLTKYILFPKTKKLLKEMNINFIHFHTIKYLAKKYNLIVNFEKDVVYSMFQRFLYDTKFKERQSGIPYKLFIVLNRLGLLHLTKLLPPWLQTPMIFYMHKKKQSLN
ncbi:MAG: class I SAM-dependent methyltransferase [Bacteroidales bacterium]